MQTIIYSADIAFQVLLFLPSTNRKDAWDIANKMSKADYFKKMKVEHYDIVSFKTTEEMNEWIMEQVTLSRF